MNLKLLALIAFVTAAIAAPASEDAPADLVHTQAGTPSHAFEPFADPLVNAEARGVTESYEKSSKSSHYQGQSNGKCEIPQCCQLIKRSRRGDNKEHITLDGLLNGGESFDLDTPTGSLNDKEPSTYLGSFVNGGKTSDLGTSTDPFGWSCQPMTDACPWKPVCCSQTSSADRVSFGCMPAAE